MAYRVADLVDTPHLRFRCARAPPVWTSRSRWAQTSDLEEPWSYLAGGELLMKNGQTLPESSRGQTALIRGLAEKGMCGLVIGLDAATPELTTAAITLADATALPGDGRALLSSASRRSVGPWRTPVSIAAGSSRPSASTTSSGNRSATHTRPNVLNQLGRDLSCRLAVLDATTGEVALDASEPVSAELRRAVVDEIADRRGAVPGVLHVNAEGGRALVVEVPDEEPTVLVTYDFRGPAVDLVQLQHLASAVAVLLAQQNVRLEHERRIGAEVMAQLCDGRLTAREADRELDERGLRPQDCSIVAAGGVLPAGERQLHLNLGRRARAASAASPWRPAVRADAGHGCVAGGAAPAAGRPGNGGCQRSVGPSRPRPDGGTGGDVGGAGRTDST